MTPDRIEAFRAIFANCAGFEPGDLQSVNERDLLDIAVACWNAGAEAMGTAVEIATVDSWPAELLSKYVEEAKSSTFIKGES
jgi:hypothetical protein